MKFRTEIDIKPIDAKIDYKSRILAVGSCFADAVGGKLRRAKFLVEVNPTGVLFNPASICRTLHRFDNEKLISAQELHRGANGYFHFDFHSSLCSEDPELCVSQINEAIQQGNRALKSAHWVIITLGTSWVYEEIQSGEVVANCHKSPSSMFRRRRLSVDEIVAYVEESMQGALRGKRVILTLSPIRHVADGLAENSLSKATLRVAIETLVQNHPSRVYYFPSYEILMDDLRDYRFYGEDMVHPSPVAVDYVWQKFCDVTICSGAKDLMRRVLSVVRAMEHRPQNPHSESHRKFCVNQLHAISELSEFVNLDFERQYFEK